MHYYLNLLHRARKFLRVEGRGGIRSGMVGGKIYTGVILLLKNGRRS